MGNRATLTFLNAGHFLIHYFMLVFPTAVIAIEKEWNLNYGDALLFSTPSFAAFAIGTLPAGWLGDRWDRRHLMVMFFVGCGGSSLLVAFTHSSLGLMVGLAGIGLFAAIYHPVGLAMVTDIAQRKGRALAINGVYGNLGIAAPALVTGWLAVTLGWRCAFAIPGLMSCAIGIAFLMLSRVAVTNQAQQETADLATFTPSRLTQSRVVAVVLMSALFGGCIFNGVTVSLPKVFDERLARTVIGLGDIGASVAVVFAVAAFAQLPVGNLLDRYGARPILLALITTQGLALAVVSVSSGPTVIVASLVLVVAIFAEIPITSWLLGRYVTSAWRARAYAAEYFLSLGVSAGIVPLISMLHTLDGGFTRLYLLMATAAVVVALAATFLPAKDPIGSSLGSRPATSV